MRGLAFILLTSAAACASSPPAGTGTQPDSVRDRLAQPTHFYIGAGGSSGAITASHYTHDGWQSGTEPVAIENGEVVARVDAAGRLAIDTFDVGLQPIDIPESVFGKPAQLKNVRLVLTAHTVTATTWSDDDDASATPTFALDLSWAIATSDGGIPLGTQHLPPLPVTIALTGGGDHVDATLALDQSGDLWSWAGLLKVTGLQLSLSAESLD